MWDILILPVCSAVVVIPKQWIIHYLWESHYSNRDTEIRSTNRIMVISWLYMYIPSDLLNWYQPNRPLRSANTTSLISKRHKSVRYGKRLMWILVQRCDRTVCRMSLNVQILQTVSRKL